jgi:hypothetical protein
MGSGGMVVMDEHTNMVDVAYCRTYDEILLLAGSWWSCDRPKVYIKLKGDSRQYWVRDRECIGADCLALGLFQHRGAIGAAGSRSMVF